jgi:hypothetical protein
LKIGCAGEHEAGFDGKIDEVRIYERALGAGEVQQTMNSTFPVAVTGTTEEIESNDAIMTGSAHVRGEETEYFFEYGPTTSYGRVATGEELEGNGEAVEVEEVAVNLAPETAYHYRLVAEGPLGTAYGKDQTFTTGERTMSVEEEEDEERSEEAPLTEEEDAGGALVEPLATTNFFGIDWDGDISQMANAGDFKAIQDSGAKLFRFVVAENNESAQAEAFVEAESHGLSALPYLGQGAFPKTAKAQKNFFKFAKEMINKYGPSGTSYQANTWEIWNEPNMFHPTGNSELQGEVKPEEFAEFYKKLVTEIRSVAPTINILAPGLFGYKSHKKGPTGHDTPRGFLKTFDKTLKEAPELKDPYDGISLHPYVFKTRNPKKKHEKAHVPRDEFDAKQVRGEIKGMIWGVHKQSVEDLKTSKQIWVTELGFPVRSEDHKSIPPVTQHEQELLLHASFSMLLHNPGNLTVAHAIYYNIQDLPNDSWEHNAGLLEGSGKPRPAWEAFRKLAGGKACTAAPC